MSHSNAWDISLFIDRKPEDVRAWWTDLPDDYTASDPDEAPFKIVTLTRTPTRRELLTYWRSKDGVDERHETLELHPDGSWTIEMVDDPKFHFHNIYHATAENDGTRLVIHQQVTPRESSYVEWLPDVKNEMETIFKKTAQICKRDAKHTA